MEQINIAIKFKNALNSATRKLKHIGKCVNAKKSYSDDSDDDSSNESNEIVKSEEPINKIISFLKNFFYLHYGITDDDPYITTKNYAGEAPISQNVLKLLYSEAPVSSYGDMMKMETILNKEVRDAREITEFEVDENTINFFKDTWGKHMYPKNVSVVPYKINFYDKKGHFKLHKDTPDKKLVGTILLSIYETESIENHIKIYNPLSDDSFGWIPSHNNYVMFYTDCPHEVLRQECDDIRSIMVFKVYDEISEMKALPEGSQSALQILLSELNIEKAKTGFILGYEYTVDTNIETLKGSDMLLASAITNMGFKYTIIPVLVEINAETFYDDSNCSSIESYVYPLTSDCVSYLLGDTLYPPCTGYNGITFYDLNSKGDLWYENISKYAQYTGNETQPEEINSIYINRALIIM